MANMRKTNKKQLNLNIPIELYRKCELFRRRLGKQYVGDAVIILIEDATRNIELAADDYKEIEKEIRQNEQKRKNRA